MANPTHDNDLFVRYENPQTVSEYSLWESIPACPRGNQIAWRQASLSTACTGPLLHQPKESTTHQGRPASALTGNESR